MKGFTVSLWVSMIVHMLMVINMHAKMILTAERFVPFENVLEIRKIILRLYPQEAEQKEAYGGYYCDFVDLPPDAFETGCPICHLILRDPYQSKCCRNNFCQSCIEQVQADHKPCPMCRTDNFEVFPNKDFNDSLNQLHVSCIYSKGGCKWKGELGQLDHHLNEVVHHGK